MVVGGGGGMLALIEPIPRTNSMNSWVLVYVESPHFELNGNFFKIFTIFNFAYL